jgi:hypothetical protein
MLPFQFTRTITVNQREHTKITSNEEVLNYLIDKTKYMNMYMRKFNYDELQLFPLASKLISYKRRNIRKQDILGNLKLKVKLDNEKIAVEVITSNNALYLFAFILYLGAFFLYFKSSSKNNLIDINQIFIGITVYYSLFLVLRWVIFLDTLSRLKYQLFKIN